MDCGHRAGTGGGAGAAGGDCRYLSLDECAGAVRLPSWLEGRKAIQDQIRERVGENLAELDGQLELLPGPAAEVEGGWYAVVRIPALATDERTVLALLERGVWVHPGYFFGMAESGWLVVSLLGPVAEFRAGAGLVVDYFRMYQSKNDRL